MPICLRSFTALPALALSLFASLPAAAAGTAFSAIDNVHFGALELTPDDGTAAGYDILEVHTSLLADLYTAAGDYHAAGYPNGTVQGAVQLGREGSTASAWTSGAPADVVAVATGDAGLGDYGMIGASANQAVHFMLRPHTVLTIAGHLATLAQRSSAPGEYHDVASLAYVGIVDEHGYTFTQFMRQSLAYADWPDVMTVEDDFTLTFANGSAEDRHVSVYFQALTNVMRIATPVPEPATVMLLCAGLSLLGARAAIARRAR